MKTRRHWICCVAAVLVICSAALQAQAPNDAADVARLVELLDVHANSVVADIGAGLGPLSIGIAPYVSQGTDIQPTQLQAIRDASARAGLKNITVVEGGLSQTNVPENSCDATFMRDVYHHFGDRRQ